jgi:hypothetical protein
VRKLYATLFAFLIAGNILLFILSGSYHPLAEASDAKVIISRVYCVHDASVMS